MATRDEQIRVSVVKGSIDPQVSTLLNQLSRKDRNVTVNVHGGSVSRDPSPTVSSKAAEPVGLTFDVKGLEKQVDSALESIRRKIRQLNTEAVIKIKVDTSELDNVSRRTGSSRSKSSNLDPNFGPYRDYSINPSTGGFVETSRLRSSQSRAANSLGRQQFKEQQRQLALQSRLNDPGRLYGQASDVILNPLTGRFEPADRVRASQSSSSNKLGNQQFRAQQALQVQQEKELAAQSRAANSLGRQQFKEQQRNELDSLRFNKTSKEFYENATISEFFSQVTGGKSARLRNKLKQAEDLELQKGIPGLANRLTSGLTAESLAEKTPLLSAKRLKDPAALAQVAFGGVFGGTPGLAAAGLGAALGGAPGALLASTVQQAVGALIDPVIKGIREHEAEFRAAGEAYSRSILGIASVLQANSTVLRGSVAAGSQNISSQIKFQEGRAVQIQQAARSKLLPLGIGGQTEATFVQGIVSALASRGINANAGQVSKIAESIGGAIQAQRPQLLENTGLLLRDLQDYLGGGPQAKKVVVGQLAGLRNASTAIQNARSGDDIVNALRPAAAFADAVKNSDSFAALSRKEEGAKDLLNTLGGEEYLKELKPALSDFVKFLQSDEAKSASKTLGAALGSLASITLRFGTVMETVGVAITNDFANAAANIKESVLAVTGNTANQIYDDTDAIRQETLDLVKAGGTKTSPLAVGNLQLKNAGLENLFADYLKEGAEAPTSRITRLRKAEAAFNLPGVNDDDRLIGTAATNKQIAIELDKKFKGAADKFSGFGSGDGLLSERRGLIEQQQVSANKVVQAELESFVKNFQVDDAGSVNKRFDDELKLINRRGVERTDKAGNLTGNFTDSLQTIDENINRIEASRKIRADAGGTNSADDEKQLAELNRDRVLVRNRISELSSQRDQELSITNAVPSAELEASISKVVETENKIYQFKLLELQATEDASKAIGKTLAAAQAGFNLTTESGAAASGAKQQSLLGKQVDLARKDVSTFTNTIASEESLQRQLKAQGPKIVALNSERIKESERRLKDARESRDYFVDVANAKEQERISQVEKTQKSPLIGLGNKAAALNPEIISEGARKLEFTKQAIATEIDTNLSLIDGLASAIKQNPNDPTNRIRRENIDAYKTQNDVLGVQQSQANQQAQIQSFRAPQALNDLALSSVQLKEALQNEVLQRTQLNDQLKTSSSALREFEQTVNAKGAGKESEIIGLARRYQAAGGSLPGALDLNDEQLADLEKNTAGAQLGAALASVGRSDLAPQSQFSVTGLARRGEGTFGIGVDAEQNKLQEAVSKTTIELEKLPIAVANVVLALEKQRTQLSYELSVRPDSTNGPNLVQGPPNQKTAQAIAASKEAQKGIFGVTPPSADDAFAAQRNAANNQAIQNQYTPFVPNIPGFPGKSLVASAVEQGQAMDKQHADNMVMAEGKTPAPAGDKIMNVRIVEDQAVGPAIKQALGGPP
jgi:hypothetical protein